MKGSQPLRIYPYGGNWRGAAGAHIDLPIHEAGSIDIFDLSAMRKARSLVDIASRFRTERARSGRTMKMLPYLNDLANAMSSSLALHDVLKSALEGALRLLEAETGSLMLLDEKGEELRIFVAKGLSDEIIQTTRLKLGESIAGRVAKEGMPRLLLKGVRESSSHARKEAKELKSAISVPLKVKDRIIGVLNVSGKKGNDNFSDDDLELLTIIISSHAAVAIDNARLYDNVRKKAEELSSLFQIGQAITSTLERRKVLQIVLDSAVGLLKAGAGSLMLLNEERGELYIEVAYGLSEEIIKSTRIKPGEGVSGKVAQGGEPRRLLKGVKAKESKIAGKAQDFQSAICVPLKVEDKIIGVLNVKGKTGGDDFSEDDLKLSIQLAAQAAVAILNAKLYSDLQEQIEENLKSARLAAIGETVAGIAHCVKNILNGLKGGEYLVRRAIEKNDTPSLQSGWLMVEKNIERISTLVLDMLTFVKEREPEYSEVEPNALLREAAELVMVEAARMGVEIRVVVDEGIQKARLDSKGIMRCLVNLVGNAVDACTENGGVVTLKSRVDGDSHFILSVSDDGCGMDEHTLGKLFTKFFSMKGSKGTGLGLPVVHKIIAEHGGTISVESKPGEGTTFSVRLPFYPLRDNSTTKENESHERHEESACHR